MHRTTIRRFAPILLAAALFSATSSATAAQPPIRPDLDLTTVPAGQACEFKLQVRGTDAKARVKSLANGGQITSGKGYRLTYTNADTRESLTFETNGSAERISAPDADNVVTVTASGGYGLILFDSDVSEVRGVEAGSAIQYTGRIKFTFDLDTGFTTLLSASGKQRDICDELS